MPFHLQVFFPLLVLACGYGLGDLAPSGLAAGVLFAAWVLSARQMPTRLWYPVTLLTGLALAAHLVPGFQPRLLETLVLDPGAPPLPLRLSWDKLLVGVTLLAWWLGGSWPRYTRPALAWFGAALTLALVPTLALGLGLVDWRPKWHDAFWLWLALNLGMTVLAEELLFRGLLQSGLSRWLGEWPALLVTTLLFGLAHLPFGLAFASLAACAGLGYGWVYRFSGRLVAPVALHLAVNSAHFLLLTYPARPV